MYIISSLSLFILRFLICLNHPSHCKSDFDPLFNAVTSNRPTYVLLDTPEARKVLLLEVIHKAFKWYSFKDSVSNTQKKYFVSITEANQLFLRKEVITLCEKNVVKQNTLGILL